MNSEFDVNDNYRYEFVRKIDNFRLKSKHSAIVNYMCVWPMCQPIRVIQCADLIFA